MNLIDYHIAKRIVRAKELLHTENASVEAVDKNSPMSKPKRYIEEVLLR